MPQLLTSNPTDMPFDSSLSLARGKRSLLIAAGLIAGTLGTGWLATRWVAAPPPAPKTQVSARAGLDRSVIDRLDVSGFQKRGNLLIGETVAPSGAKLRLVLDARTHELVGMRVVDDEATSK